MLVISIVLILAFMPAICAEERTILGREAAAYYEAGEYEKAKQLFEQLQQKPLKPWQRSRLEFNLGTVALAKKDWPEAEQSYARISTISKHSDFFVRALKTNEALLQYKTAHALLRKQPLDKEASESGLVRLFAALDNVKQAIEADCCLQFFFGNHRCNPPEELVALRQAIKRELALALKMDEQLKIAKASFKYGLPLLLASINSVISRLDFLETKPLDEKLSKNYRNFFAQGAASWLPLWRTQSSKISDLQEACSLFQQGVCNMRQGELGKSRSAFLQSQNALTTLMTDLWGQNPTLIQLQALLGSYEEALNQIPIQLSSIQQIAAEQNTIELDAGLFARSNAYLQTSLRYSREAKQLQARFFLLGAMHAIRHLVRTKIQEENPLETILANGIEDQAHALLLVRLATMMDTPSQAIQKMLIDAERITLNTLAPFLSVVREKQLEGYPKGCQCAPWNAVIPLFEKGLAAAKKALPLIKEQQFLPATKNQERAIKQWKQALQRLQHREKQPSAAKEEMKPKEQQSDSEAEGERLPIEEVLRILQQMHQEDRFQTPSKAPKKEGAKPW